MSTLPFDGDHPPGIRSKIERLLEANCPSPEQDIISLCMTMAKCPVPGAKGSLLRHVTVDIDDFISQIRWHLGQALLLMEIHPTMLKTEDDPQNICEQLGMPMAVQLGLREYVLGGDRVMGRELSENWKGGTVGGWIFHMMIDSAIYRAFSALDRLAVLIWYAAELSEKEHVFFRAGKLSKVHDVLSSADSKALVEIAESELFEFITTYRNGFSHTNKAYSRIAGFPPADSWTTEDGERVLVRPDGWNADDLFALANAAYGQVREALPHVSRICQQKWPASE